ncbi:MAG: hypothetical protein Q9203_005497 [Teloschistes exilis]
MDHSVSLTESASPLHDDWCTTSSLETALDNTTAVSTREVHLSSQPTSKTPETVVIADGHVLGGPLQELRGHPQNFDSRALALASFERSNSSSPSIQIRPERSSAASPEWAPQYNHRNGIAWTRQSSSGTSYNSTPSQHPSGPSHKRSRTSSHRTSIDSISTTGSLPEDLGPLSNGHLGQGTPLMDFALFQTNSDPTNKDVYDFMTSLPTTVPPVYPSIGPDFPAFDVNTRPEQVLDETPAIFGSSNRFSFPSNTLAESSGTSEVPKFGVASEGSEATSPTTDQPATSVSPSAKRCKKLTAIMNSLRVSQTPTLVEHNETIDKLYKCGGLNPSHLPQLSLPRFVAMLENLCDVSGQIGFVYGLLSWEIFRREEERLTDEVGLSSIAASKAVNKQMVETLQRAAKTRDWASDGRKAAKIVFNVLQSRSVAERSFAILLLATHASLDGMLKIAHFPATREAFSVEFAHIVEGMAGRWGLLSRSGYKNDTHDATLEETIYTLFRLLIYDICQGPRPEAAAVGTGYYLAKTPNSKNGKVTLFDHKPGALETTKKRSGRPDARTVVGYCLKPHPFPANAGNSNIVSM